MTMTMMITKMTTKVMAKKVTKMRSMKTRTTTMKAEAMMTKVVVTMMMTMMQVSRQTQNAKQIRINVHNNKDERNANVVQVQKQVQLIGFYGLFLKQKRLIVIKGKKDKPADESVAIDKFFKFDYHF